LALAAHPIRIEAPIPGKSLVGFELPNKSSSIVRLRHVLEVLLENPPSPLAFSLGRDVRGQPVFADLAKLPHLLIAGATGSGKSIAINNIIITLTYLNSPRSLRFILIDPKRVELTPYNGIPHLLTPVVSQAQRAINALKWAIAEMETRYETLAQMGARDIASFNSQVKKRPDFEFLPYIVITIDELADLMASHKREMEAVVVRLAQMARAVGIHLIASTQRPSTDVVTGLIKANITSRIAFKVASQVDSRTILDAAGAEKLLGNGDMLYMSTELQGLKRIQGTFVSEKEVQRVANYLRGLAEVDYEADIGEEPRGQAGIGIAKGEPIIDDELYEEAKRVVIEAGKGSSSLLQRRLRIGYSRAASLLDALEAQGIVGPAQGAKPRKVLVEKEESGF
jgi:S-DNA-T family DNA segregation ATPase FtsK/SpoIIIE